MKVRDVIFNKMKHIERMTIHAMNEDNTPSLWENITYPHTTIQTIISPRDGGIQSIEEEKQDEDKSEGEVKEQIQWDQIEQVNNPQEEEENEEEVAPKDFTQGPWMDPSDMRYSRGKYYAALFTEIISTTDGSKLLKNTETAMVVLAEDKTGKLL